METRNLSGREYAALQSLFAALSHMQVLLPTLQQRAQTVPNLWRDLKLLESKTESTMKGILSTIPEKKLRQISTELAHTRIIIKVLPPGLDEKPTGMSYIPTKELNTALGYVCEHECIMCDQTPTEARKCPIRKMLDNILPHEVQAKDSDHCKYSDFSIGLETEE